MKIMIPFVSLHNQTDFSILDSIISVKNLFQRAKELEQPAIAVVEHGSFASVWDALKASRETGVKLITGCEFYFLDDATKTDEKLRHLVLLAKNAIGYRNVLILNKLGFDQRFSIGKRVYPIIDWKMLKEYSDGVICLTACGNGIISQLLMNRRVEEAEKTLLKLRDIFGENLGIEVQPNNMKRGSNIFNDEIDQQFLNRRLIDLGKKHGIKIVPACNSHYLTKEESGIHDVLLAIGSHQPIYSNYRLRYPVADFYLKSGDEVKAFFARNYGEEFAVEICANTMHFANLCETPDWIDPKFSNPAGKELPVFPVKDQSDYSEFIEWIKRQPDESQKLSEDKLYLRFKCYSNFETKIISNKTFNNDQIGEYRNRLNEEIDVLEYQDFSSYMLIVSDYINWAKTNNIAVGPGRGCVGSDTLVLADSGFKKIIDIKIGDCVYTHTGQKKKVLNTFEFDIKDTEKVLEIKTQKSCGSITLTRDHKVLGIKNVQFNSILPKIKRNWNRIGDPQWIQAKDLSKKDLLWMTYPQPIVDRNSKWNDSDFDLTSFCTTGEIKNDHIRYTTWKQHPLSVRNISKLIAVPYPTLLKIKKNLFNIRNKNLVIEKLTSLLSEKGLSISDWIKLDTATYIDLSKTIILDGDFYKFLGLWIGDGFFINQPGKKGIGFSIHSDEVELASFIRHYIKKYGFRASIYRKKNEKALKIEITNELLFKLVKFMINDYQNSSNTKHLPFFFRQLNKNNLWHLLEGVFNADGSINRKQTNETIATTSKRLALELKEALLFINKASSILMPKIYTKDGAKRKQVFVINFSAMFSGNVNDNTHFYKKEGYFCRIADIKEKTITKVYDIEVESDHSYLTTNFVSHNSVGGSLVAYLLDIHKADPIKYDLIFARFQNKERCSPPDIDQDISTNGRDSVIDYITAKYGADNVASISNLNRLTPKVYVRDVARACELGGTKATAVEIGNAVADIIPKEIKGIEQFQQLDKLPLFVEYGKRYPELLKYKSLLGKVRNFSTHAAAIVISKRPLVGLVPLRKDKDGTWSIEYEKDTTEANGLVKMDILGLSSLDLIEKTLYLIQQNEKPFPTDYINYDTYDQKTYDLISSGNTYGVFQFGTSTGTIELCKKINPKNIEDLAIITTLARPAAANIRDAFIKTRNGKLSFSLLHPSLKNAFEKTFGFGLFDESILKLAQDVAGWSLHSADRVRKMIKEKGKNPEKDAKLREEFIKDAIANNIEPIIATRIWDEEIKKFAGYTFNKSHAILYSFLSYTTAYLKAHYPIEFLLANLIAEVKSNAPDAKGNIDKIKKELRSNKIKILPPNINTSQLAYTIIDGNKLLTGLDALKFVGDNAIKDILDKRPFKDFLDFMSRVSSKNVRANNIQALAASGAMDTFDIPRKLIFLYCSDYRKKLQVWMKKHDPIKEEFIYPFPNEEEWDVAEKYALEQYYLGEAFVCKAPKAYGQFFNVKSDTVTDIRKAEDRAEITNIRGIIKSFYQFRVKKEKSRYFGQTMIKAIIEDGYGEQCSCTIFPDRWKEVEKRMKEINRKLKFDIGVAMHFSGNTNNYEDEMGIVLDQLFDIIPPPALPVDLKAKKINLKIAKSKASIDIDKEGDQVKNLMETVEDNLFDEGLIDLNEEEN